MFSKDILSGKSILVTGGGSGLGLAMARRFVELGARVAICGRTEEKLKNAAREISPDPSKVLTHTVDIRDHANVGKMITRIVRELGGLDGLVNNAAGNFLAASEDLSPNAFKAVVDIVLTGSFNCTQQFGQYLIQSKKTGVVLSIVTTYTETGSAFVLPSACAKAGVYTMTTSLAAEWGPYGIRLNAIAPGLFPTEGAWSRLMPDDPSLVEKYKSKVPLCRFGRHEELANLAVFLLSDLSSYITGECVTIDGGERLQSGQFNTLAQAMPREQLRKLFQMMKPKKTR